MSEVDSGSFSRDHSPSGGSYGHVLLAAVDISVARLYYNAVGAGLDNPQKRFLEVVLWLLTR